MKDKIILGSHVGLSSPEYLLGSVKEALSYNANAFMIYTGPPQNTIRKEIATFKVKEAHELLNDRKIAIDNVIVHVPYIINLCSSKEDTRKFGIEFLINEIKRTEQLGFNKLVLHPGSGLDQEKSIALKQVIFGINTAIKETEDMNVIILIETMAGKGSEVGTNILELKTIINGIENKDRIGICLDTCHLSDSGVNINNFDDYLIELDKEIGLNYVKCIHLNDSMNPIGSRKDRHQNIGYGNIGFDPLLKVVYHEKLINVPKILETPYYEQNNKYLPPYKQEIEMIKNKSFVDWKK